MPVKKVRIKSEYFAEPGKRVVSEKTIFWSNSSDRKWLMNHLHWAMNNRTSVTLTPSESF